MSIDRRVLRRYEGYDEDARLWGSSEGELVRLRTWDLFERFLPAGGRVLDVGGGPGAHASHLAGRGHDVHLVDPVPRHVDQARSRAAAGPSFTVAHGDAAHLDQPDASVDAVLLMGPLYHLVEPSDRLAAWREAWRVLRPGGVVLGEVITRNVWLLVVTTTPEVLEEEGIWDKFDRIAATGLSQDPDAAPDGSFWAYFHTVDELAAELEAAQFDDVRLVSVEGHAWLLGAALDRLLADPERLLRALRLVEAEPSLLGASAHVMGIARKSHDR